MYILTYVCCIIQYYLVLITTGIYPNIAIPSNDCTIRFNRNKHKPYYNHSLRDDINPMLIYKSSPSVSALRLLLHVVIACL